MKPHNAVFRASVAALFASGAVAEEPPPLVLNPDGSAMEFINDDGVFDETTPAYDPSRAFEGDLSASKFGLVREGDGLTPPKSRSQTRAEVLADRASAPTRNNVEASSRALSVSNATYTRGRETQYGADLTASDLRNADLGGAQMANADLSYADLTGADLRNANLAGADLAGAVIDRADLRGADLSNARFTLRQLRRACYDMTTRLSPNIRETLINRSGAACILADWRYLPILDKE